MTILRFEVSKRGFNQILNGMQFYIDKSGDKDTRHIEVAIEDICKYSRVGSKSLNKETGEVESVSMSITDDALWLAFDISDWYGCAKEDGYDVDYTGQLVDKYNDYIKGQE